MKSFKIKLKIGILISVRTSSQRLPNKALLKICGKETISLLIERMKLCKKPDFIVLCTTNNKDDDVLVDIAKRENIEYFRGEDEHVALRLLDAAKKYNLDHFVRVTGDDLLRCIKLIDKAINSHLKKDADYTFMSNVFYGGDSEIVSIKALQLIVEKAEVPENTEYLSWYLDNPKIFKIYQLKASDKYFRNYRLSLDTIEDFKVLNAIYEKLYKKGIPVNIIKALKWLDKNPELTKINSLVKPKLKREELNLKLKI